MSLSDFSPENPSPADAEFGDITPGSIPIGTLTEHGVIQQISLTAYRVDDRWVPFGQLHGTDTAEPLVRLNDLQPTVARIFGGK